MEIFGCRNNGLALTQYYRISNAETDANRVVAGSQDNGTHQKNGSSWQWISGGDGMDNEIDHQNAQNIYASYQNGYFIRSTNGGVNFVEMINAGTYGESGAWVSPIKMDPNNPSIL